MLNRRRALILGAGGVALAACRAVPSAPVIAPAPPPEPVEPPEQPLVAAALQSCPSRARGRDVQLAVVLPTDPPAGELPVCLVLHGRGGSAAAMIELGLPEFLAGALRAGSAPFGLVAVDGGDSYWIARDRADDPQAMLRDELPTWLPPFGLAAVPRAVAGISMGGFGALVYARGRGPAPPAVAVLSPALYRTWADARARDAFADESSWAAAEPLRHVTGLPRLGVWCADDDPWIAEARQLAAAERAAVARFGPGRHDVDYWRQVMPDVLGFLAPPTT